jgi:hypothetical protein
MRQACGVSLAFLVAFIGCDSAVEPPEPPPTSFSFLVGDTVYVTEAFIRDLGAVHNGTSVSALVTWVSRDTSVAIVGGHTAPAIGPGAVRGVRPGETFVVGTLGAFADSVRVTVRTQILVGGQWRTQARGDAEVQEWGSVVAFNDERLHQPHRNRGWFVSVAGDGAFVLSYPRLLQAGTVALEPPATPIRDLFDNAAPEVTFSVWEPNRGRVHVGYSGRIVLETYDVPDGAVSGPVIGYVSADAWTYLYDSETGDVQPTEETARLFVEFRTGVHTMQLGWLRIQFDGGSYAGQEMELNSDVSREIAARIQLGGASEYVPGEPQFILRGEVEELHEGVLEVGDPWAHWYAGTGDPLPPTIFWFDGHGWPWSRSHATGGTLTITEYREPYRQGEHLFSGRVVGAMDLDMVTVIYDEQAQAYTTIDSFKATATFDAPVQPWLGM